MSLFLFIFDSWLVCLFYGVFWILILPIFLVWYLLFAFLLQRTSGGVDLDKRWWREGHFGGKPCPGTHFPPVHIRDFNSAFQSHLSGGLLVISQFPWDDLSPSAFHHTLKRCFAFFFFLRKISPELTSMPIFFYFIYGMPTTAWLDERCRVCTRDPNWRTPGRRSRTCALNCCATGPAPSLCHFCSKIILYWISVTLNSVLICDHFIVIFIILRFQIFFCFQSCVYSTR